MQISSRRKTHFHWVLCLFVFFIVAEAGISQSSGDIPYLTKTIDQDTIGDGEIINNAIELEPVTIIFSKANDISTPQNIRIISPEVKLQFGRQSIPQILNTTPGLVMYSGAYNTNRITIRGIGSRNLFGTAKIKAYLNDIPLTNGVGETSLEDIDLSLVEDIKVVKGPTSSLYGAGLGGMIHLNTRSQSNRPSQINLEVASGRYGLSSYVLGANVKINSDHRLIANFNRTESTGYRDNNHYDRDGFALIGDHNFGDKVRLSWIANYIDLVAQIPSSLNFTDYSEEPRKAAFNWQSVNGFEDYNKFLGGLSAAIQTSDRSIWKISLFTNSFDSYESRPFNILEENNTALGLRSTFTHSLNTNVNLNVGIEGFNEKYKWKTFITNDGVQGDQISDNEEDRRYINLFLNGDISMSKRVHLQGGLNFNSTKYDYRDLFDQDMMDFSGNYRFDAVLSPYLNINVELGEPDNGPRTIAYGLLSHGFSPPSLEETLQPDGQINPDIQPEKGLNVEFGINGQLKGILDYKISAYSMTVKDLLVARRTAADQFIGINAGKTLHNGIEASLSRQWNWGVKKIKLSTDLSLHDYKFKAFIDGDNDYSGNPLTGTPKHVWRSQVDVELLEGLDIGIGHYSLGAQSLRDDNSISFDGYTLIHAFIKHQKNISPKWSYVILLRGENLFNEQHASMLLINAGSFGGSAPRYYYPGLPANLYGSIKLSYRL